MVVTGQGVVSSLGHDPDEFYNNLLAGKSGVSMIEGWDTGETARGHGGRRPWLRPSTPLLELLANHACVCPPAEEFSTRFAGQIKSLDTDGYILKKWEKRIDGVMK